MQKYKNPLNQEVNTEKRKKSFFRSEFIQNFSIVVLACSDYIWNKKNDWQINEIFGVSYDLEKNTVKVNISFLITTNFGHITVMTAKI